MRLRDSSIRAVVVGALSYAALSSLRLVVLAHLGFSISTAWWQGLISRPVGAVITLSAGLVAGYLRPNRALLLGLFAGVVGELALVVFEILWSPSGFGRRVTLADGVTYLFSGFTAGRLCAFGVFGMAGGALAAAWRSNYRLERP